MTTAYDRTERVRYNTITLHERLAKEAFSRHRIHVVSRGDKVSCYRCASPDTNIHSFCITLIPGSLIVNGDIGELIVSRSPDMLSWSNRAIRDIAYFASKVAPAIPTKQFDAAVAEALVEGLRLEADATQDSESAEGLDDALDALEDGGPDDFCRALADAGYYRDYDFPDLKNWTSNFLWCREAVKWFIDHLENQKDTTQ